MTGFGKFVFICLSLASGGQTATDSLPSTLQFINTQYSGHRFAHRNVVVFGGTSGMGFASAAMFIQECSNFTVVAARNRKQGFLAASVLRNISRPHCGEPVNVLYAQADIRKRDDIRRVLSLFVEDLHVVVNSAAIAGFFGDTKDLPADFGPHDGLFNNVYGAFHVTAEALTRWEAQEPKDFVPAMVHFSSEQGMAPAPRGAVYSSSKHAIIGMVTSVAGAHLVGHAQVPVRVNAVLPGLVSTPFTWNQVRGWVLLPNGTLKQVHNLQPWECWVDGKIIDGDCADGGSGYGCPCEDVSLDDPRVKAMVLQGGQALWPMLDPREAGAVVLDLVDPASKLSGYTHVLERDDDKLQQFQCFEGATKPLWESCPQPSTNQLRNMI